MAAEMDIEELKDRIRWLLDPEPEEGIEPREIGHPRLSSRHNVDTSYLNTSAWEGSAIHHHTRLCSSEEKELHGLTRNSDVSIRLFETGLRLFGDSLVAYHGKPDRTGQLHYYPPMILTFWSGFETFVRHTSELMLTTVPSIPEAVANYLRDLAPAATSNSPTRGRVKLLHPVGGGTGEV